MKADMKKIIPMSKSILEASVKVSRDLKKKNIHVSPELAKDVVFNLAVTDMGADADEDKIAKKVMKIIKEER